MDTSVEHDIPQHYESYLPGVTTMDALRASMSPDEFYGFCKGNAMKYIIRAKRKGGKKDLAKAADYIGYMTECL